LQSAVLFFRQASAPIALTAKYIAQLNTPLSMIIIGTTMTQISFGKLFSEQNCGRASR
jgi:hypothetical protein